LLRVVALKELTEAEAAYRRAHLIAAAAHWHVLRIAAGIVDRARQPFPGDPIRTLDAIHLASLLVDEQQTLLEHDLVKQNETSSR
jgi:hypothetical protein